MIVITGMHRSGTSMIADLLHRLGCSFGGEESCYGADAWNPRGYFERSDVMDVNSQLITGFRRNQGSLERMACSLRYATMPRLNDRRAVRLEPKLLELAGKYGSATVKDPRFCLTMRFWESVTSVEKCVVCLRHPEASVASLTDRGFNPLAIPLEGAPGAAVER